MGYTMTNQATVAARDSIMTPPNTPPAATHRRQTFLRQDSFDTVAGILQLNHSPNNRSPYGHNPLSPLGPQSRSIQSLPSDSSLGHSLSISGDSGIFSLRQPGLPPLQNRSAGSLVKKRSAYDEPSTQIVPGTVIDKPWIGRKSRLVYARYVIYLGCILGLGLAALVCWIEVNSVPHLGSATLVFEDQFDTLDYDRWKHEISVGGFGNGEFEWTTNSTANSYVENGTLYIVPTLTSKVLSDAQITGGYTLNLTADGTCTYTSEQDCVAMSNSSTGQIINPVQSARLTTLRTGQIRFGKVEVVARMPKGDWLWPAIWMLPVDNAYGAWPLSGEIDIAESRGNDADYKQGGRDVVGSTLHWGAAQLLDRFWLTTGSLSSEKTDYSEGFHTYGLEWTPDYMMIYIDSRVRQTFGLQTKKRSFWELGKFPSTYVNQSTIVNVNNPWVESANNAAPFDKEFYLILNVAVGGTNGWFPDNMGGKTWYGIKLCGGPELSKADSTLVGHRTNAEANSAGRFYNTTSTWLQSWPQDPRDRALAIKSVRMWQLDGY